jgi:hypothetical protein
VVCLSLKGIALFFFFMDGYFSDCFPLCAYILGRNGRLDSLIAKIQDIVTSV